MRWTVLTLAHRLRTGSRRGQMAVIFIVLMVVVIVLASMTMNLGQVAQLKTATANAADAGALAGASWVASGTNEVALISRGMSINVWITQLLYVIPFCWEECDNVASFYLALLIANVYLKEAADDVMHAAWDNAHAAALFTAIQNAPIDATGDDLNAIQDRVRNIQEQFEDNQTVPNDVTFRWMRRGADGIDRESSVNIRTEFLNSEPAFETGGYSVTGWCWSWCFGIVVDTCSARPCQSVSQEPGVCLCLAIRIQIAYVEVCVGPIVWPCLPGIGWVEIGDDPQQEAEGAESDQPTEVDGSQPSESGIFDIGLNALGKAWSAMVGAVVPPNILNPDRYGVCEDNWCLPIFIPFGVVPICPESLEDRNGEVRVTVTATRARDGALPFWRMRYPDQFRSQATARYQGARPRGCWGWSQPDGFAQMVDVN